MPLPYSKSILGIRKLLHLSYRLNIPINVLKSTCVQIDSLYKKKNVPKNDNEQRELSIPKKKLKILQKKISLLLIEVEVSEFAHAYIKKRSPFTLALNHCRKPYTLSLDIKSFFPTINNNMVNKLFLVDLSCSAEVAYTLTRLTTYMRQLPQGSPTSPAISNLVMRELDGSIGELAAHNGITYGRYADDMFFSSSNINSEFISKVKRLIISKGFKLKTEKEVFAGPNCSKTVLGLNVNGPNPIVPRKYRRQTRAMKHRHRVKSNSRCSPICELEKIHRSILGREQYAALMHTTR